MADQTAYQERVEELFNEHQEFEDVSLRFSFHDLLFDFEDSHEPVLSGKFSEEQMQRMGLDSDVIMSEEGLAVLRNAAVNEPAELTNDLRKQERIADRICAELDNQDAVSLNRLVMEWGRVSDFGKLRRYQAVLTVLSQADRDILDLVFFEEHLRPRPPIPKPTEAQLANLSQEDRERFLEFFSEPMPKPKPRWPQMRLPVNAGEIFDTLAREFPEKVFKDAEGACERSKATRGKRVEKYVNRHPDTPQYDDSGKVIAVIGSFDSGYKLVDECPC